MSRDRIAVVGGTTPLLEHAVDLGLHVTLVTAEHALTPVDRSLADELVITDFTDGRAVHTALAALHERLPFRLVLSLTEDGLLSAAEAAEQLGVSLNPTEVVRLLRDKRLMRARLAVAGLSPVRAVIIRTEPDLHAFLAEVAGPVIVKPVAGSGSTNIHVVRTPAEVAALGALLGSGAELLAEEFLTGTEISVEAFSHQGRHVILAFTDKTLFDNGRFVEVAHVVPSAHPAPDLAAAEDLVISFLDTVGLKEGPSHTEVMLTPDGPRIIESHNRVGGDKIRLLVAHSTGFDPVRLALLVPLGRGPCPSAPVPRRGGGCIQFVVGTPGVVTRVSVPAPERDGDVVVLDVAPGDVLGELDNSDARAGHVFALRGDRAEAVAACERMLGQIKIEMAPPVPEEMTRLG